MKAAPVLALQLALTGALASRVDRLVPIVATGPCGTERIALVVVGVAFLLCLAGAIWAAATVYVPRSPKTGQSFIFFEDIAAMEYSAFESKARNMNSVLIEQQLIDQIYPGFRGCQYQDETSSPCHLVECAGRYTGVRAVGLEQCLTPPSQMRIPLERRLPMLRLVSEARDRYCLHRFRI